MFRQLIKPVSAHCDVPCGIYETDTMKHAADTCLKMTEKILALGEMTDNIKRNDLIRMVNTKEKHASKAKRELYILWSDYFKSEHLQLFPDLHEVFWQAAKQCSKVKQTVSIEECHKLIEQIAKVDEMFVASKK